ncbi:DUF2493 domain-containing protein [Jannaschia sp. W003]|uniref:DUF2493 domain-containing protein n=1 Tax=Jannaschia sp. W003 TaxID=2867012 RepID=UPI0021A3AC37|nr:DUF2493 domain-containing protein [Jannaschia sp. W003]UWQ22399.1 DUF2493 domain-containing protein [Jannaschia sp. W003]
MAYRVLVCGGRAPRELVDRELDRIAGRVAPRPVALVVPAAKSGDAPRRAEAWAGRAGADVEVYATDYPRLSRSAAAVDRAVRMLREGKPDLVLAFVGLGSTDLTERAQRMGVPVRIVPTAQPVGPRLAALRRRRPAV